MEDLFIDELGVVNFQNHPLFKKLKPLMGKMEIYDLYGQRLCS